jgi:mRNA interferase MazF
MDKPFRGQVWTADLNPVRGHEQGEQRPALVVSSDRFNQGPSELVAIVPITSKNKKQPLHVAVNPPEGGLTMVSYILCDQLRIVSVDRLKKPLGEMKPETMSLVEDRLRVLLEL